MNEEVLVFENESGCGPSMRFIDEPNLDVFSLGSNIILMSEGERIGIFCVVEAATNKLGLLNLDTFKIGRVINHNFSNQTSYVPRSTIQTLIEAINVDRSFISRPKIDKVLFDVKGLRQVSNTYKGGINV